MEQTLRLLGEYVLAGEAPLPSSIGDRRMRKETN
jgi:hypothetical protein